MNKKLLMSGCVAVFLYSSNAFAQEQKIKPFIGLDFSAVGAGYDKAYDGSLAEGYSTVGANVGAYINENVSVALSYLMSTESEKEDSNPKMFSSYSAFALDASYFFKGQSQPVSAYGSIGIGSYTFDTRLESTPEIETSEDNIGFRFGVGAKFNLSDATALKAGIRHTEILKGKTDKLNSLFELTFGLEYCF